jgi:hypothetical protein
MDFILEKTRRFKMELLKTTKAKLYDAELDVTIKWADDTIDVEWYTDDELTRQKIYNNEFFIALVSVELNLNGIKFENRVGGILVQNIEELEKAIEEHNLINDTIGEFATKFDTAARAAGYTSAVRV